VASIATSWSSTARLALLLRLSPDTPSALTASPSTPYSPFPSLRGALLCCAVPCLFKISFADAPFRLPHQERDVLMSASHDGTVRLWSAQVCAPPP